MFDVVRLGNIDSAKGGLSSEIANPNIVNLDGKKSAGNPVYLLRQKEDSTFQSHTKIGFGVPKVQKFKKREINIFYLYKRSATLRLTLRYASLGFDVLV